MNAAIRLLEDRAAIRDVLVRYARGVDARDFDGVASCFWPEVDGVFAGVERNDRDDLIEFISGVSFFHTTMHFMGPSRILVQGDTAWLDSPAMISHRADRPDGGLLRLDGSDAHYCEKLERRDGVWRIRTRGSQPDVALQGWSDLRSDDATVAWLLDLARIDDALAEFARARDRTASCDSSTHLLGHPIVALSGERAEVAVRALVTRRNGYREPRPDDTPFTKRWDEEATEPAAFRLELRRGSDGFAVAKVSEHFDTALPEPALPASGSAPALALRARVRNRIARDAWALDRRDGATRLLGNQWIEQGHVQTYVYRVAPGAHWSDDPQRWVEPVAGDSRQIEDNRAT